MQYLPFYQTFDNLEETMYGRKICQSAEADVKQQSRKVKRYRSAFTTGQINYLEKHFRQCPYIGNASRKEVANALNIPERAIKIWFQNRRMKEKKEVINKEYNLDRRNNSINNVELTNDTLNNVHSSQSANDRQCSLQSAVMCNAENKTSKSDNVQLKVKDQRFDTKQTKSEYVQAQKLKNVNIVNSDRNHKSNCQKNLSSGSRNISKCNLGKVYDNKNFIKYLKNNNNDGAKTNKSITEVERRFEKHSKNSSTVPACQDLPEDLSARSKTNLILQDHPGYTNLATFIPFCNSQNYYTPCVSEGSIIWKPVNVMPFVSPNNLPIAITESQVSGMSQFNMQKSSCNCDCHLKNKLNFHESETKSQSKYVIAVPFNHN